MEIPISIASEIAKDSLAQIGGQLGYLIYFDSNIESLKDELKKTDDKRDGVQKSVDAAKRNGEVIKREVESWLENVGKMFDEARDFEDKVNMKRRSLYGWCPNLKSPYSLSRKAKKITERAHELQIQERGFLDISIPAPPQEIWSTPDTAGIKDFESRRTVMNGVMEALKNNEKRMIGICGMGGVGKTTMVKQIIKRFEVKYPFDKVVMAVVSQTPNIKSIQGDIAVPLWMEFKRETESGRAQDLRERLMNFMKTKRILIILVDVWSELDFQAIGLPFGPIHKGCKILLTSRNKEVCNTMRCEEIFTIQLLTKEEAWELFKETVGESLEDLDLHDVAKLVANECAGLPIAILTVAKALQKKRMHEWVTALEQLKKSLPENISGMDGKVYSSLKFSYDKLESDEIKSCFLLCCLFPEDYDIPIEYLVRYGLGQGIFGSVDSLLEARNRVHSFINTLRRRFLLLASEKTECIKMHEIVRDVAISIASKDSRGGIIVRHDAENKGWPKKATSQDYTAISLSNVEISDGLDCPKLKLLQLQQSAISIASLFQGMKELKVLSLLRMSSGPYLKESLAILKNLQSLCLDDCQHLGDISCIGGLENLEILSFARSGIHELPGEIGFLKQLRLLDTTECRQLSKIPHGLLSSLIRLEELYMAGSFDEWVPAVESKDESMASLPEVMNLSDHLKVLAIDIGIPDPQLLPKVELLLKNQTTRFHISVRIRRPHHPYKPMHSYLFDNCLMLCGGHKKDVEESEFMESETIRFLVKKSEELDLRQIKNLKYVLNELDQEGLQNLRSLVLRDTHDVEYLLNGTDCSSQHTAFPLLKSTILNKMDNLKAICHGKLPKGSFVNLRSLNIEGCQSLKYAFSVSLARNLSQLQSLVVEYCMSMEEIILKERMEEENASDMIAFPKLTKLQLIFVPSLIGFYIGNQHYCKSEITKTGNHKHEAQAAASSSKSKSVEVATYNILFPSICHSLLQNLEELKVEHDCFGSAEVLNVFFDLEGHMAEDCHVISAFSQLQKLWIAGFNDIEQLWKNVPRGVQGFQNLRFLKVQTCEKMKYVFSYLISIVLVNLQEVDICMCEKMETIVAVDTEEDEEKETCGMILFPKMVLFKLKEMPNLVSLCPDAYTFAWSSMKSMYLERCQKLKTLGSGIPQINKSEAENLNANVVGDSSTAQEASDLNTSSSTTSIWCPGISCAPLWSSSNNPINESNDHPSTHNKSQQRSTSRSWSRPNHAHNFNQILSYPVIDKEVIMATNLEDSNTNDNLERLEVRHCESLEVIFVLEKIHHVQAFNKLRELVLRGLRTLMHIWEKGLQNITGFGNLRLLEVSYCGNLRYLFSPTIAKLLMSLEEIEVSNCKAMEKIVAEEETTIDELTFNRVRYIRFEDLPNLECFCTEAYSLKWPSLKQVDVLGCSKLKPFAPGFEHLRGTG